jgi:hypothetical protein
MVRADNYYEVQKRKSENTRRKTVNTKKWFKRNHIGQITEGLVNGVADVADGVGAPQVGDGFRGAALGIHDAREVTGHAEQVARDHKKDKKYQNQHKTKKPSVITKVNVTPSKTTPISSSKASATSTAQPVTNAQSNATREMIQARRAAMYK